MNTPARKQAVRATGGIGALVLLGGNVVQYLEHREDRKLSVARIEQAREKEQTCLVTFLRIDKQHDEALAECYTRLAEACQ